MILQYSNGITECYEEAQSISVGEINVDWGFTLRDVIYRINKKIKPVWGEQSFESRTDNVILKDSKKVKFAIINAERSKEKVLLFMNTQHCIFLMIKGKH